MFKIQASPITLLNELLWCFNCSGITVEIGHWSAQNREVDGNDCDDDCNCKLWRTLSLFVSFLSRKKTLFPNDITSSKTDCLEPERGLLLAEKDVMSRECHGFVWWDRELTLKKSSRLNEMIVKKRTAESKWSKEIDSLRWSMPEESRHGSGSGKVFVASGTCAKTLKFNVNGWATR